jgi:transposase
MFWVGLDLHKRYITACAVDDEGHVVAEHRRLAADVSVLLDWLTGLGGPVTVAMEATLYWAWLHDQLRTAGIAAVAAHPYQVKLIWQARCKTDPIDARKLADLLRANLLPAVWVPDAEVRARRKLLRGRAYLVRLRTSVKNRIHGHLTAENLRTGITDLYGRAGRSWLATVSLSPMGRLQVDLLLELVDALGERIGRLDDRVKRLAQRDQHARLLQTWPGIGLFGAALVVAEIGTIARFRSSHQLAAYAGLTPSTQSSGDRTRHGAVGRAGSPWLKWILIEIVQSLKLVPGPVGAHYQNQKLLRSKGKAKATVAAARKLCCYLYWCLKEGWSYDEWLRQYERLEVRPVQPLGSAA